MMRSRIHKRKQSSYTKMMKTLLLQNQQIIIQQQNMMFMVIKQFQHSTSPSTSSSSAVQHQHLAQHLHQPMNQQQSSQPHTSSQSQAQQSQNQTSQSHSQQANSQPDLLHHHPHLNQHHHHQQQQNHVIEEQSQHLQPLPIYSQISSAAADTQQTMQQVASQLQENLSSYLTPAASEQDPISDEKQEEDDLAALLEGDGLLHNNLLYNPQTDIGSVTPYKNQPQQHQTPSYYSSGCESLTTPRVEQQRQPTTTNISQNVVKNLADSFKSPSKPKINVQILSGSATRNMKNSKAKIIQRMNISEFLRHVHPEKEN